MSTKGRISIEIVYGTPDLQVLETVRVSVGSNCEQAVSESGIARKFPNDNLAGLPKAIWGKPVTPQVILKDGDRIEILRPLTIDPRDARRRLAEAGQFMGGSGRDEDVDNTPESD